MTVDSGQAVDAPDVTVVVPSHGRRLRLLWLLNSLEDQSLDPSRWEVVVVHDYPADVARDIVDTHPLAAEGRLRGIRIDPSQAGPARQRNIGWRAARGRLIAFTDDDCRATPRWLESLVEVAEGHPGAIVQGATSPDPFEEEVFAAPHVRSLAVSPPELFAQTCNILYPREALAAVDGFDENLPAPAGEDTDLALRARQAGSAYVGAPEAVVHHAIESYSLAGVIRLNRKWQHLAYVIRRHPEIRDGFRYRVFWRESHARLVLALVALLLGRRWPAALVAALPYVKDGVTRRGTHKRALAAGVMELPGRTLVDLAEVATMLEGSARYRTLVV
jgi:GT2 family glycosyltransferase